MVSRESLRPGGRSARIQAAVHDAVLEMLAEMDRNDLTIPLVAQRANVTPSTIYRRWGDLPELLADVALARFQSETEPKDTGDPVADLCSWIEQYAEEMSSAIGRQILRDILIAGDGPNYERCCAYTRRQLSFFVERAAAKRQAFPPLQDLVDYLVSPIIYRILFAQAADMDEVRRLTHRLLPTGVDRQS